MTLVETIRYYCKQKKTSIAALERELDFGNGTIRKWDKSPTSYERLQAVASALGVTVSDLTGEKQKNSSAPEGAELKKLTPDKFKEAYHDMSISELHAMLADIMQEIQGRNIQ